MRSRNDIFEGLLREIERITAEIIVDLRHLPSYASVPADALHDGAAGHVRGMVSAARDRRTQITLQERRLFAQTGELRAQQGVPVEDLLRGWRIGVGHVWEETSAAADRFGVDYADRLADLQALLAFTDNAMIVASSGHRQAELALTRQDEQRRTQFMRAVLFGSLSAAELRIQAELYGLDTAQVYQPIVPTARTGSRSRGWSARSTSSRPDRDGPAYSRHSTGTSLASLRIAPRRRSTWPWVWALPRRLTRWLTRLDSRPARSPRPPRSV